MDIEQLFLLEQIVHQLIEKDNNNYINIDNNCSCINKDIIVSRKNSDISKNRRNILFDKISIFIDF